MPHRGRKVPRDGAFGLSFEAGIRLHRGLREPPNACDPSMRRNRAGSGADICSWSPGAKPFLGSSIRKKL